MTRTFGFAGLRCCINSNGGKPAIRTDCSDSALSTMEEKDFFVRKAIGWALRQHARVAPEPVIRFLTTNRSRMSGLSFREAAKHLDLS